MSIWKLQKWELFLCQLCDLSKSNYGVKWISVHKAASGKYTAQQWKILLFYHFCCLITFVNHMERKK